MGRYKKEYLIPFLVIIFILGLILFLVMYKDLRKARIQLRYIQLQIMQEKKEKGELKSQLTKLTVELIETRNQLSRVSLKLSTLEKDNAQLQQTKQELEKKLAMLESEKQRIEARLHSLKELKQAMRQVKKEIRNQKLEQYLASKQQQKEIDAQRLAMGNRGFVIKDGKSTYKPTVKIEVRPFK